MGFYVSPSTNVVERDLSTYVPGISTSIVGYSGDFTKGPVNQKTLVTSERYLAELFGEPTTANFEHFFSAAGFLNYGNSLYVVRMVDKTTAQNSFLEVNTSAAVVSPTSAADYIEFHNSEEIYNSSGTNYSATFTSGSSIFRFAAKYPGVYGSLMNAGATPEDLPDFKIALVNNTSASWNTVAGTGPASGSAAALYESYISDPPTANDEYVVIVLSRPPSAKLNTDSYDVVEVIKVSSIVGKKDEYGNNIYIEDRINTSSRYILAFDSLVAGTAADFTETELVTNGTVALTTPTASNINTGYDLFDNAENFDVNILVGGANTSTTVASHIIVIAESRKDCIAILDVPRTDVVDIAEVSTAITNVVDYRTLAAQLNPDTSYAAMYANWLQINDKYNDKLRWIPSSGHVAGIYSRTDEVSEPWFAPAGFARGGLRGVIKLAINPDRAQRDTLYKNGINPIVSFSGRGLVVWGQKTLQKKPSAYDRVNVRRLFIVLEKAIATAAKEFVFEQNDEFTRAILKNMIDPFLKDIKGRRGLVNYHVDTSTNINTPQRIDAGELWADIYIEPTKAGEFVVLRFNATKSGVNFEELLG